MNLKQLNILLADDDDDDCLFFKEALKSSTLTTHLTVVSNGEYLMELLNKTPQLPDVIFLDLNMPRKNGFECLSEIKLSDKLKQIPVIVFSTSFEQEVVNRLYQNGAHYFIRKPSEFSQFKKIIQQMLLLVIQQNTKQPIEQNFVITLQNN